MSDAPSGRAGSGKSAGRADRKASAGKARPKASAAGTAAGKQARQPLGITEVSIRDGHQSLLATRWRTEDMLPVCEDLDACGFWSIECWGGATYDACLRYLGENPWQRLRSFRQAMPNTRLQMLLRGQNLLGYRHYADDVVHAFVERSAAEGIDVFRVFDALNDVRNMAQALAAVRNADRHAQGTLAYTTSPVHDLQHWLDLARRIEDLGVDSIAIKDMAGLLKPYAAQELVSSLRETVAVPLHMQCHATTGLSTATALKAVEAGLANVDTSISAMSMTYGHSATETIASIFAGTDRDPGLDFARLERIAGYMRKLRHRYRQFEGTLRGVDARILHAQIPGGMFSNLESQLRQQNALDRLSEVIEEIPRVRQDLGYIPLVTPSSQIVGTQAVFNVLSGERYGRLTAETEDVVRGRYGATPAPVSEDLRQAVLKAQQPLTQRPADLLQPEMGELQAKIGAFFDEQGLGKPADEDLLMYAMFPRVAEHYFANRDNPAAFEQPPAAVEPADSAGHYLVTVGADTYRVSVSGAGEVSEARPVGAGQQAVASAPAAAAGPSSSPDAKAVLAPLAAVVLSVEVAVGASISAGQLLLKLEAMKMETEVLAPEAGTVHSISVSAGDNVVSGAVLLHLA